MRENTPDRDEDRKVQPGPARERQDEGDSGSRSGRDDAKVEEPDEDTTGSRANQTGNNFGK